METISLKLRWWLVKKLSRQILQNCALLLAEIVKSQSILIGVHMMVMFTQLIKLRLLSIYLPWLIKSPFLMPLATALPL